MRGPDGIFWRLSLANPASGVLFTAWGDALDLAQAGLPDDLIAQLAQLQAESRAFWRRAVESMARDPRRAPDAILAEAGRAEVHESAEAVIVALTMARPDVMLDIDIALSV